MTKMKKMAKPRRILYGVNNDFFSCCLMMDSDSWN